MESLFLFLISTKLQVIIDVKIPGIFIIIPLPFFEILHYSMQDVVIDSDFITQLYFWHSSNFRCLTFPTLRNNFSIWSTGMIKPWYLKKHTIWKNVGFVDSINFWSFFNSFIILIQIAHSSSFESSLRSSDGILLLLCTFGKLWLFTQQNGDYIGNLGSSDVSHMFTDQLHNTHVTWMQICTTYFTF